MTDQVPHKLKVIGKKNLLDSKTTYIIKKYCSLFSVFGYEIGYWKTLKKKFPKADYAYVYIKYCYCLDYNIDYYNTKQIEVTTNVNIRGTNLYA